MRLRLSVALSVVMVGAALAAALHSHAAAGLPAVAELNLKIREWDIPSKGGHPHDPAVGPDGSLWFTEQMVSKLARLDPATGEIKEYTLKGPNDGPHGLVADREGNIWYTGNFAAYIGKLNPRTGEITQYKMPDLSLIHI